MTAERMLAAAEKDYADVLGRCDEFDQQLAADGWPHRIARSTSGCAELAYRQAVAAHKLVAGPDGRPLFFSKENFSNGSIGTVDVTYPSAPLVSALQSDAGRRNDGADFRLLPRAAAGTSRFAAHDVGTYPLANGQTYPEDMPVEECGNMLILAAAIAQAEGNADYASRHWQPLTTWAEYLRARGLRSGQSALHRRFRRPPGAQRQSVDQGDHRPGQLRQAGRCAGRRQDVDKSIAELARSWRPSGSTAAADGDHYRLTFDKQGHLEPEVQPGVGPAAGARSVSARGRAKGDRLLPDKAERLRPAARQPQDLHQERLDHLDRQHGPNAATIFRP